MSGAGRLTLAALALLTVASAPPAALAAAPSLSITHPSSGSATNSTKPQVSGTSTDVFDGVSVEIYAGSRAEGSPLQTLSAPPPTLKWSVQPSIALPQGRYTAQAEQTNAEHETGHSPPVTFVIDTTPPVVTINPVASPTNHATPQLSGTAGTAEGDAEEITVTIHEGATVGGSIVSQAPVTPSGGKWSETAPHLNEGTYTAQATQADDAGNNGTSTPVTFVIDTTPPILTLEPVTSPTNNATPPFAGAAGTANGDAKTVTVDIYSGSSVGEKPLSQASGPVSGSKWSTTAAHLNDGTYTVQALQTDEAGNTGASVARTFTVDTVAPKVTITSPAANELLDLSRPLLTGDAGHASGDQPAVAVKIFRGASPSGTVVREMKVTAAEWTAGVVSAPLANGEYTASAEQVDQAGNVGTAFVSFTIAANAPTVTLSTVGGVTREQQLVLGSRPTFAGAAGTAPEDGPTVSIDIYEGTTTLGTLAQTFTTTAGATWSVTASTALPDGTYTAQATQVSTDFYKQGGASEPVTFTVDGAPPLVTLSSPATGSTTSASSETLSGAAGTAEGDLPGITVDLYSGASDEGEPVEAIVVQQSGGSWQAQIGGLAAGAYTALAHQSDDVGNVGSSEPVTFTVTALEGEAPSGRAPTALPGPSASFAWFPHSPQTGEAVSLVSTSTDAGSPLTGFAWALAPGLPLAAGGSTLSTTFTAPGIHHLRLRVTDAAGLSDVVEESVTVASPSLVLMQPFPVVRIAGSETARGITIRLLTVMAPLGANVTVNCRGTGCPAKPERLVAASRKSKAGTVLLALRRYDRPLAAGAVLQIKVSRPGQIGKYTRLTVRRGKLPVRVDMCLSPASLKPIACPT